MGTVVTEGDYTQIGTGHHQIIHHNHINNHNPLHIHNPHYTININVSSQQISASGGDLQQVMHSLHSIVGSAGQDTPTQCQECTVYHERGHQPVVGEATPVEAITNERILDCEGTELLPGHVVRYSDPKFYAIYLGNGEVAQCQHSTQVIVREKLDVKRPFVVWWLWDFGVFTMDQRIQRALQCIGGKCPVREERCHGVAFAHWVCTGNRVPQISCTGAMHTIRNVC